MWHALVAEFGVTHKEMYSGCAAKKENFYGHRLHLMVINGCVAAHFVVAEASHHDATISPKLLETQLSSIIVGGDEEHVGLANRSERPSDYQLVL